MRIYISGPIMHATPRQQAAFDGTFEELKRAGHEPVNPKHIGACPTGDCEKMAHEIEKGMEHSWACFMRYDIKAMLDCDAILMLPGWQDSHGARLELQVASACGLEVWHTYAWSDGDLTMTPFRPLP